MLYGTPGEISTPPLPKPRFVLTDTVGAPFDFWQKARGYVALLFGRLWCCWKKLWDQSARNGQALTIWLHCTRINSETRSRGALSAGFGH